MPVKKYISKSHIGLSVQIAKNKYARISFDAITGGGSVYYTADKSIQRALESHSKYNKLFKLDPYFIDAPSSRNADMAVEQPMESDKIELTSIPVSCLEDAKDYLCDKFSVSRTKLRGRDSIRDVAASHGIVFEGI